MRSYQCSWRLPDPSKNSLPLLETWHSLRSGGCRGHPLQANLTALQAAQRHCSPSSSQDPMQKVHRYGRCLPSGPLLGTNRLALSPVPPGCRPSTSRCRPPQARRTCGMTQLRLLRQPANRQGQTLPHCPSSSADCCWQLKCCKQWGCCPAQQRWLLLAGFRPRTSWHCYPST